MQSDAPIYDTFDESLTNLKWVEKIKWTIGKIAARGTMFIKNIVKCKHELENMLKHQIKWKKKLQIFFWCENNNTEIKKKFSDQSEHETENKQSECTHFVEWMMKQRLKLFYSIFGALVGLWIGSNFRTMETLSRCDSFSLPTIQEKCKFIDTAQSKSLTATDMPQPRK